jgi:hypothetical protein
VYGLWEGRTVGVTMRRVTEADLLTREDVAKPDSQHTIQGPLGQVVVPRPKPGMRFVGWTTAAAVDGPWTPVPLGGQAQRFVRAYYEPRERRG